MNPSVLIVAFCLAGATPSLDTAGSISGVIVDGSNRQTPLAGAEAVLRASQNGTLAVIDQTTADDEGRFSFGGLPVDGRTIYLAGVNYQGVHNPGPRVRIDASRPTAQVTLVAYETVHSPSPLISRRHEIELRLGDGFVEVQESLTIENPTLRTYVGNDEGDDPPVTLSLTLPEALEHVTFDREFHGRNFQLHDSRLTTNIPWRPGDQQLKFTYRLPTDRARLFARQLDRPTEHMIIRVVGAPNRTRCNVGTRREIEPGIEFEHHDTNAMLPAGYMIELELDSIPLGFGAFARITAGGILALLIMGTIVTHRAR